MATETAIHISEDEVVTLTGANVNGTYLNTATVTWSLKRASTGAEVTGGNGTMSYVTSSNGNYEGIIESTITGLMVFDETYWVDITGSQGAYNLFRRLVRVAKYRAED